jgi:hypothetical protein
MSLESFVRLKEKLSDRKPIEIDDLATCYHCKTMGLNDTDQLCPNCGFPQKGTLMEMKEFIWDIEDKKNLVKEHESSIEKGRIVLFVIAGLELLGNIIVNLISSTKFVPFLVDLIVIGIFIILAFWSMKRPFTAILTGFILYVVTYFIIPALINPILIASGIVLKFFIIAGFIYGIHGSLNARKIKKELDSLNPPFEK